ncbi:hypothetical protein GGF40_002207 [Coemansia sp. RSA 1286]|nr:hypothetical protein GGF40_002207 [Coemansia sp. RSA 1286]
MWLFGQDSYSINGKVVLLTGALGAIGKTLTTMLVDKGAKVAMVDICDNQKGQAICERINQQFDQPMVKYLQADLQNKEHLARIVDWSLEQFGQLDVLINNAGIASPAMLYEDEVFDRIAAILDINLRAPIETTRLFVKYAQKTNRQGVVINMASLGGIMPNRGGEVYGAVKAALIHLTRASKSLAPSVRVSAIAPYYVKTPMVLNNPKLKNNSTVYPELMLDIDQVCRATIRCVEDKGAAGETFALIGRWTYLKMRLFDFTALHIKVVGVWSLFVGFVIRFFARKAETKMSAE